MKLLVAKGQTGEDVQKFMYDFYMLSTSYDTSVTIIPERKECIEKAMLLHPIITFCIILSPAHEACLDYLIHLFETGHMRHCGWADTFIPVDQEEVKAMKFLETMLHEKKIGIEVESHFGWCDDRDAMARVAQIKEQKNLERYHFNDN